MMIMTTDDLMGVISSGFNGFMIKSSLGIKVYKDDEKYPNYRINLVRVNIRKVNESYSEVYFDKITDNMVFYNDNKVIPVKSDTSLQYFVDLLNGLVFSAVCSDKPNPEFTIRFLDIDIMKYVVLDNCITIFVDDRLDKKFEKIDRYIDRIKKGLSKYTNVLESLKILYKNGLNIDTLTKEQLNNIRKSKVFITINKLSYYVRYQSGFDSRNNVPVFFVPFVNMLFTRYIYNYNKDVFQNFSFDEITEHVLKYNNVSKLSFLINNIFVSTNIFIYNFIEFFNHYEDRYIEVYSQYVKTLFCFFYYINNIKYNDKYLSRRDLEVVNVNNAIDSYVKKNLFNDFVHVVVSVFKDEKMVNLFDMFIDMLPKKSVLSRFLVMQSFGISLFIKIVDNNIKSEDIEYYSFVSGYKPEEIQHKINRIQYFLLDNISQNKIFINSLLEFVRVLNYVVNVKYFKSLMKMVNVLR